MLRVRVCRGDETAELGGDGNMFDVRGGGVGGFRGLFTRSICMFFIFFEKKETAGFSEETAGFAEETGRKIYFRPG
jgi:hypothetical protein